MTAFRQRIRSLAVWVVPVYSVAAGLIATAVGAAASLLVSGDTAKIIAWVTVSAVLAVAAICVYPLGGGKAGG